MPAAWVGAAATVYSAYEGSQNHGGSGGPMYTPTGLQGADQGWQGNQAANQGQLGYGGGFANQVDPRMLQAYQQLSGINYQPYLDASQRAGQQYGQLAGQYGQAGGAMMGEAGNSFAQERALQAAGQNVYNMGVDPQHELYNRMMQQTNDQSAATNSMYGLGSSGVGAGIQNQNASNFNIDWQNQQLQRAAMGTQAMGQADRVAGEYGTLGGAQMQAGLGYYGQVPGMTQQAAAVPMQAQQQVYGQGFQNASQYGQALQGAMSPYQSQQNAATQYMGLGGTQQYNAGMLGLQQQQQNMNNWGQAGRAVGNLDWSQLSGLWGNQNDPYAQSGGGVGTGGYTDQYGGSYNNPSAYVGGG